MKKITSIKTRITLWYTTVMFVLIAFVLLLVGTLSYRLSIENIEKDVTLQVTQVSDRFGKDPGVFQSVDNGKDFKNVSIYEMNGKYITGQYIYDIANIEFSEGKPRRETVDGKEYIVYDMKKHGMPGGNHRGFWIRGVESVNSTILFGRSAFAVITVIIPLILLMTAFGGYYITKKAFLPISEIIRTANEISEQSDISKRIIINPETRQDELYSLSMTLNNMLDKIETLIMQEKQFTSDASHELRTPISVILAQGEYLLDIAKDEKEKELAENIVSKSKQVSSLISRLLFLARADQKRQKLNTEKVDIDVIFDIAIENVTELAEKKNITIIKNVSDDIIVNADELLLLSAVTNLVSNAVKYGKMGGMIEISAKKHNTSVVITVKDDGIGIEEDKLDKIWGRFYRTDDVRNDEYDSYGLGLPMVKSIVELHGGTICVKSKPGEGTEFEITLY